MRWLAFALGLAACGGKGDDTGGPVGGDGGGAGGGGGGGDDTGEADILYPSGDRILLYTGHGGYAGDSTGKGHFDDVDARWKDAFDWNTDVRDFWPDNIDEYRAVLLIGPNSTATAEFDAEDVAVLQGVLDRGARVVVTGDLAMCGSAEVGALLEALGVSLGFTGEGASQYMLVDSDSVYPDHQVTAGVSELRFKEPCWVDPGSGERLVLDDDGHVLLAAERPGRAGDVVVVADFQFFDDEGYLEWGDNGTLADNLVVVDPNWEPPVDDTGAR